jgi:hypothetical protein
MPTSRNLILAFALLVASPILARKAEPLPDFTVFAPDGKATKSADLKMPANWVLVYIGSHSGHSAAVLDDLNDDKLKTLNNKLMIIVGGATVGEAKTALGRYANVKTVSWYADPKREALRAMKIPGVPACLGMSDNNVQWQFIGTHPKPGHLKSMLKTWRDKK